ncbi:hypothetical protein ACT29H_10825 [Thermophagus sp. OGC60D27]|uniref:hypothetical protein n=1 Tax=Thermophagus sp. OGC60D27 TaxID=3458415 RepID=UPI004037ADFB
MKHQPFVPLIILIPLIFMAACGKNNPSSSSSNSPLTGIELADTIIYPVDIVNLDTTDTWADQRLKRLQRQRMINLLFESVYQGKAQACDYFTDQPLSTEKLREMEASGGFDRDKVSQLQFEEAWHLDTVSNRMIKEVQSVLLAWPVYDNKGNFIAYKAGFVVKFD